MNRGRQIVALLRLTLASVRERLGVSLVVTFGVACAVGVLISMLAIGAGIDSMVTKNISPDRFIVRGAGGNAAAELSHADVPSMEALPAVRTNAQREPLVSADVLISVQARKKRNGARASLTIMGVGERYAEVYPEIRITNGRAFQPGLHEVIAGVSAQRSFRNLEVGDVLDYQGTRWTVVGTFEADGGLVQTRLLADANTLRTAFKRDGYDYMTVVLDTPMSLSKFKSALASTSQIAMDVSSEAEVRAAESRQMSGMATFLGYFVGSIMAVGAIMGALNCMYMLVAARRREFATLRALGFRSFSIGTAVLTEAMILALPGAFVGVLLPSIFLDESAVTFVGLNFSMAVTPQLAAIGVLWALVIGLLGGLMPAVGAARVAITQGLRAI